MNEKKFEEHVRGILKEIGEDIEREGIKATPARVCRLWKKLYYGYGKKLIVMDELKRKENKDPNIIPITVFKPISKDMLVRKVHFLSTCEHHLATIHGGECWVGIIPNKKLMGMNKIDAVVKYFAARLQIQEKLTADIANWIQKNIQPLGVGVVIKANHLCAELQGDNGHFTTSAVRGNFEKNSQTRNEFLKFVENGK